MNRTRNKKNSSKPEHNWLSKNLENLEKSYWPAPEYDSYLVITCHNLRKKQLKEFSTEDLRIMIGQNIGLKYLIPLALETLKKDILAEGDLFKGDLLTSVLNCDQNYWKEERENWKEMLNIFNDNVSRLENHYTIKSIKRDWFESFEKLKKINL